MKPATKRVKRLLAGSSWRTQGGQTLVVVAVVSIAMIGFLGLIMDSALVEGSRRQAQRAADAAAQAAGFELANGGNASQVTAAANLYATLNGIPANNCVLVESPPSSGSNSQYAGTNNAVRVEVTLPTNTTFMRLFLARPTINVRATATAMGVPQPVSYSVLLLEPSAGSSLFINGNGDVNVGSGTVYVNSSSASAVKLTGNASLTAGLLSIVGNWSTTGNATINATIATGAPVVPDPLDSLAAPVLGDYATSLNSGGTAANPSTRSYSANTTVTINPGIYWGGLSLSGNATAHMNPGRYIMAGGGLTVSGNGKIDGANVFIYNTQDPQKTTGAGAYAAVSVTGNGYTDLQAPNAAADSTYTGLLIFNDRASTTGVTIHGNGGNNGDAPYTGYIYNKNGEVTITGNGSFGSLGAIAKTMKISGNGSFSSVDTSRVPYTRVVRLVE